MLATPAVDGITGSAKAELNGPPAVPVVKSTVAVAPAAMDTVLLGAAVGTEGLTCSEYRADAI